MSEPPATDRPANAEVYELAIDIHQLVEKLRGDARDTLLEIESKLQKIMNLYLFP